MAKKKKKETYQPETLREAALAAELLGVSYGKYMAMKRDRKQMETANEASLLVRGKKRERKVNTTYEQLFKFWQEGKTDSEIGRIMGVSQQFIQRLRNNLELPTVGTQGLDTSKYRLLRTKHGIFAEKTDKKSSKPIE